MEAGNECDVEKPAKVVVVQLEGPFDIARGFEVIKGTIRRMLAPDVATSLLESIHEDLRHL